MKRDLSLKDLLGFYRIYMYGFTNDIDELERGVERGSFG